MQAQTKVIFSKLGLTIGNPKGDELPALCPFHNDRHMGNFFINLKTGLYHCFACGAKGMIYELATEGIDDFRRAWEILKKDDELVVEKISPDYIKHYASKPLSQYAINRGITENTLRLYSVHENEFGDPIFFVRGWDGGIQAFWMRNNEDDKYYLLQPLDSKVKGHLFGLHLPPTEKNVLTEGFFDSMSVFQDLGYKTVCGNGVFLTARQIENLKVLQPLYVMLDGDAAGKRGRNRLFEQLEDIDVYFCGGYYGDPDLLTKEEKMIIIENAKSRTEFWSVYEKNRCI